MDSAKSGHGGILGILFEVKVAFGFEKVVVHEEIDDVLNAFYHENALCAK